MLWSISRFTHTIAGIAAAAAQEWEAAEEHFQIALQQAESFPDSLEQAEIRRFHAMMLIDRAAPGDREKAPTLLREALESYQHIGMPRHVDLNAEPASPRCRNVRVNLGLARLALSLPKTPKALKSLVIYFGRP